MSAAKKIWRYARWPLAALLIIYLGAVLAHVHWPVSKAKSDAAVAAIRAQRLTMRDVDGSNLPPEPDPKVNAATVEGIDANKNGIRDDVELAIFKKYLNQTATRTALIQYAHSSQTRLTKIIDGETWAASVFEKSRAYFCISKATGISDGPERLKQTREYTRYVDTLTLNTEQRTQRDQAVEKYAKSAPLAEADFCDID